MLGLSWAFFTYGSQPVVIDLAIGLEALVVGVLVNLTLDVGAQHAAHHSRTARSQRVYGRGCQAECVVSRARRIGGLCFRPWSRARRVRRPADSRRCTASVDLVVRLALATVPRLVVVAGATPAALSPGPLAAVTADMAKIGAVGFGNGTAIMPILHREAVAHHRLTRRQFGMGIGFGQVTPVPSLSTAAFVGYAATSWWGGVAAGVAIYALSVAVTMVVAEICPVFRHLGWVRWAMTGVMAAITGLLAGMVLVLSRAVLPVPAALGLTGAAFVVVRVLKRNTLAVFAAGLAVWVVYLVETGRHERTRMRSQQRPDLPLRGYVRHGSCGHCRGNGRRTMAPGRVPVEGVTIRLVMTMADDCGERRLTVRPLVTGIDHMTGGATLLALRVNAG